MDHFKSAAPEAAPSGLLQAPAMTFFYSHPECALHEMGKWHPESPLRLSAIDDQLIASGIDGLVRRCEAPLAPRSALERVHAHGYLDYIEGQAPQSGYVSLDPDTAMNRGTMRAVVRAAGAALAATDAVMTGEARNAFCSVRPPGHHALSDQAMGFCFVNNVAVAARHALEVHGLERVAVVDFDVHHGNGTEAVFAGDARVLMVSFFQHPFYPYSGGQSHASNMVNVPLPAGADGVLARAAVEERWLPALEAFSPQMIFISAGFDAHREDDLGGMRLVEDDYAWITRQIMDVAARHANGRIVSCLEGGYNLSALGRSVVAHIRTLAEF